MKVLNKNELPVAASILQKGGLIAFPTETVFGLGVIYDNKYSYDRLVSVKRRPPEKPFTLMCSCASDIEKYAHVNAAARKLIEAFVPGQFTIILKAKDNLPLWAKSSDGFVGIRVPDDKTIRDLIEQTGKPLLVPSANRSGETPSYCDEDVNKVFGDELDAIIKGESTSKVPSTIVMVDDDVKIIRLGLISGKDIKNALAKE